MLISGLVPALAAGSVRGGKHIKTETRMDMMAERETVREGGCRRTADMAGLARNLDHDPDPEKGGKTTHDRRNHLSPPDTRRRPSQKIRGGAGLDPAREREGKEKDHHLRVHRKLQAPVFHPQKTLNSYRPRNKERIPFNAPSKRKTWLK